MRAERAGERDWRERGGEENDTLRLRRREEDGRP